MAKPNPFDQLPGGITVDGKDLAEYFQNQYATDAVDEANQTTRTLSKLTYTKPPKHRRRGRTKKPDPLPVKTITKEEFMEEQYQKLYDQYTPQAEAWIGGYLRQDGINKGLLTCAMLQLGFRSCKEISGKAYDICQTYQGNCAPLKTFHASSISSRISTWMLKPSNGSYLYAFIETEPLETKDGFKPIKAGFRYRLWPPLIQINPKDLVCLARNPNYGGGQPFTLTDLLNKVPEARAYLDEKIPQSEQRIALKRKLIAAKKKETPEPDPPEKPELKEPEDAEADLMADAIDKLEEQDATEIIDEPSDVPVITESSLNPTEALNVEAATQKALQWLERLSKENPVSTSDKTTLDININVNFSFGRRK